MLPRVHDRQLSEQLADQLRDMDGTLGPEVVRVRGSIGEDWSGDPAIFFRVVLSDAATRRGDLAQLADHIISNISERMHLNELDYGRYFNFRGESEQQRLKNPEWE